MPNKIILFAVIILCTLIPVQSQVHLKGEIGVRVFESSDNPHIVDEPITITKGATVTIKKGSVFLFKNYAGLKVQGSLIIQGTKEEPVIFTSFNDRKYNPDAEVYPNAFDWNGISIEEASGPVELHHFLLMYSVYGVKSKNEKILINSGLFANNGQCDVVIKDKMKVVIKDEPFSYSHTKKIEPEPDKKEEETAKKEEPKVVPVETKVTPPVVAQPVVPAVTPKTAPEKKEKEDTLTVVIEEEKEPVPEEKKKEPKEEPVAAKVEKEKKKPVEEKPKPKVSRDEKNKNRGGVRISFNWFPGEIPMQLWDDSLNDFTDVIDEDFFDDIEGSPGYSSVYYNKLHLRFNVHFMIKTGKFLTIDIGPGFMLANRHGGYKYSDYGDNRIINLEDIEWHWLIVAPNISGGINFVKRFYPLKINAGAVFDVNFNIFRYMFSLYYDEDSNITEIDVDDTDFRINASFGPRIGVEILGGSHFGFSLDFLYRFYQVEKIFDLKETYTGVISSAKWKFRMPGIGLGAGFNFYF